MSTKCIRIMLACTRCLIYCLALSMPYSCRAKGLVLSLFDRKKTKLGGCAISTRYAPLFPTENWWTHFFSPWQGAFFLLNFSLQYCKSCKQVLQVARYSLYISGRSYILCHTLLCHTPIFLPFFAKKLHPRFVSYTNSHIVSYTF